MSMWMRVAFLNRRDRPAHRGFRRDVAHAESSSSAAEPAVGEQRDAIGKPRAHDGASDAQHLAHARPSARAFIADHDDIARVNLSTGSRRHGCFLGFEHARRARAVRCARCRSP